MEQKQTEEAFGELAFLCRHAEGLNFADAEDRAIFRGRVAEQLKLTKVEAMREWINGAMRDRASATRAVADAFIARAALSKATGGAQ